jgi:hypothetical protein
MTRDRAKALGLTIPSALLATADEVIELRPGRSCAIAFFLRIRHRSRAISRIPTKYPARIGPCGRYGGIHEKA